MMTCDFTAQLQSKAPEKLAVRTEEAALEKVSVTSGTRDACRSGDHLIKCIIFFILIKLIF